MTASSVPWDSDSQEAERSVLVVCVRAVMAALVMIRKDMAKEIDLVKLACRLREEGLIAPFPLEIYGDGPYPEDLQRAVRESLSDDFQRDRKGWKIDMGDAAVQDALYAARERLGVFRADLLTSRAKVIVKPSGSWAFGEGKNELEQFLLGRMQKDPKSWQFDPRLSTLFRGQREVTASAEAQVGAFPFSWRFGIQLASLASQTPIDFLMRIVRDLVYSKQSAKEGYGWRYRPSALDRVFRFEKAKWFETVGEAVLFCGRIWRRDGDFYFASSVYYTRSYDIVRLQFWDGVQVKDNMEYAVVGIVTQDAVGPVINVLGIFPRAPMDIRGWIVQSGDQRDI